MYYCMNCMNMVKLIMQSVMIKDDIQIRLMYIVRGLIIILATI
jgi:hypothetical protein